MNTEEIASRLNAQAEPCRIHSSLSGAWRIARLRSASAKGKDGRTLIHCFAGCTIENLCDALKIKVSDLFSGPGTMQPKPRAVREAEKAIAAFRNRLTPRERVVPVTVIYCDRENLDAGIATRSRIGCRGRASPSSPGGFAMNIERIERVTKSGPHVLFAVRCRQSRQMTLHSLKDLEKFLTRYVILPARTALPLTLWVLMTYTFDSFDAVPYLVISSPAPRCGKTRLLECLELVASNLAGRRTFRKPRFSEPSRNARLL